MATAGPRPAAARLLPRLGRARGRLVYRFSTRRKFACRACQEHHRYVIGSHRGLLDAKRAHVGCNCPILRQRVSERQFRGWFPSGEGVIDLRQLPIGAWR